MLTGAQSTTLTSVSQAVNVIESANRNRVTSATAMNDASSRSHSVLVLDVQTRAGARILRGKLHLVDLAGSERVKKSEVTGQAFDEAIAINNSLTTLGRCVQALAAGPKAGKPPFRETKLTRLLSAAFGGRANTVLLVCVAPTASDSFETVNSLQFGQQAMSVKVQAKVNASVDYAALQDELFWKFYEAQRPRVRAEMEAWSKVRPVYESQQALRVALAAESDRVESMKLELEQARHAQTEAQAALSGKLARRKQEHERKLKAMRKQQAASAAELERLRALASSAGVPLPERAPSLAVAAPADAGATPKPAADATGSQGGPDDAKGAPARNDGGAAADPKIARLEVRTWWCAHGAHVVHGRCACACVGPVSSSFPSPLPSLPPRNPPSQASKFGAARLHGDGFVNGEKALEEAARTAIAGDAQTSGGRQGAEPAAAEEQKKRQEMEATVGAYQTAVERAWADVQRLEDESQSTMALEKESEAEAAR